MKCLAAHIAHGTPVAEDDLIAASYNPYALVYLGLRTGSLSRFRGNRVKGPTTPLTNNALAFERAEALAQAVAAGMDGALDWVRANG